MKMPIRPILTVLAAVMLLVGTFAVAFAAPQCGYVPQLNTICNYGGCDLAITSCAGNNATNCPNAYESYNAAGAYACTYTGSKTDACVPALGGANGTTPLYTICMGYEECEWLSTSMICQPSGFYGAPCWAPYYQRVNC